MSETKFSTLCYIEKDEKYLMLHRTVKKNDVNKDKWIGVGGHFEYGESPEDCLLREVKEETGLKLTSWKFRGILTFLCDDWPMEYISLVTADEFEGEITACNEGVLEWVDKKDILSLNLWEGDKIFFKLLAENEPFFSLKLVYRGDCLRQACLNGKDMELFDILTPDGKPTGIVKERSIVHTGGDLHGTSHIWLVRRKQHGFDVLLQKRSKEKDAFPGCYDVSSAGHMAVGDDYLHTAVRELSEELGVTAEPEDFKFIGMRDSVVKDTFHGKPFHNHELSAVYVYETDLSEEKFRLQKEEVDSVLWMDFREFEEKARNGGIRHCIFADEIKMLGEFMGCK